MTTALEPRREAVAGLAKFLEGRKSEIVKILPPGMSVERVVKTAILAVMSDPDIVEKCTPVSIYRSIMQATLMGLSVGDGMNEGYLVRYKTECTFRASYLGWAKLATQVDGVDMIRASVVRQNDQFRMSEHPPALEHSPQWVNGSRGNPIGAVAAAYSAKELPDGRIAHALVDYTFVTAEDLGKARKLADKYKPSPAWRDWPEEMAKKVAIRRLCKMLPRNGALSKLAGIEGAVDNGEVPMDPDIDTVEDVIQYAAPQIEAPSPQDAPPPPQDEEAPQEADQEHFGDDDLASDDESPASRSDDLKSRMIAPDYGKKE